MQKNSLAREIEVAGIKISLSQKRIKNLHLKISVPDGEVKASAPFRYKISQITDFVLKKIDWIKKSQKAIRQMRDEGKIILPPKFISGEEHYFFGKKFQLQLLQNSALNRVDVSEKIMQLQVKKLSNLKQRQKIIDDFYRAHLRKIIPELIRKNEQKMQVRVKDFGIKKMKTRWGTCNVEARRIWLNLELAKKPIECLEFIVIHEMVHLFERHHNKKFFALMDKFMPDWKIWQQKLN
ncbi:MAG: M48 family peptidase [Proteobacteria bacterium]|nr:M48 family peptidase [Pseudomonadota bacterium]